MNMTDFKVYLASVTGFTVSFLDMKEWLQLVLLVTTIGYTATKWYYEKRDHSKKKK